MNKHKKLFAILALLVSISGEAAAESVRVDLGWGNITPCSRATNSGSSLLGNIIPDTIEWADQRVYVYTIVEAPTIPGIQNDIQQCAVQGAAAATLSAIIASPAAAMPVFQSNFTGCLQSRAQNYFSLRLEVSDGQCMWKT
jgi:hypothetical protein